MKAAKQTLVVALVAALVYSASAQDNVDFVANRTKVNFLGKSPNFRIYPDTSLSSYLQLKFGKIQELDASNNTVNGHLLNSLAGADPVWTAQNVTINGTNMTMVMMTVDPSTKGGFKMECPTAKGGARRSMARLLLGESSSALRAFSGMASRRSLATAAPNVTIRLYFGGDNSSTFRYGPDNVTVAKGGMKFNIEASNWPFCATTNKLSVNIEMLVKGDAAANASVASGSDGSKNLTISLGDNYNATIMFAPYAYNISNGTAKLNVGLNMDTNGGKTSINVVLPNPDPYASVVYDPTVTTATTQSGGGSGSAGAVRTSALGLLGAMLLGVFMARM